ncbi:hypothetical protein [Thalassococcus lentus]|uniref:Uncharacterized protein n=1 Tax=Thalassococcus lentus TaxID=1210524 RepID=A0ABT4XMY0_9RHOB|nr:hypothetical protein [Thalassococcus lentus]MDA7423285.1 hypothetical protein [Thalassococcus lentus]
MALTFFFSSAAGAQMMHGHGHSHGADGTGHDEVTMPGLRGLDATEQESLDMEVLFRNFKGITRTVENLPNGIRTVTVSDDPDVMDALINHTVGMIDRVGQKRDPKVFIQSPTLDIFFARAESIRSEVEVTDEGLVVVQTSEDPEVVAALHIHAAEVSDMVNRGMHAVHERMMQRNSN